MNFVDAIIVLLIFIGYFLGKKRGFLPQLVSLIGFFLIVIGSFILKNPVSQFLYEKLPFVNFMGVFKGVTILNIILYEVMAFSFVMALLYLIFKIILGISKLFNKMLEAVPIVEILNKIVGGLLGIVENYLVVFIVLYILTLPFFNFDIIVRNITNSHSIQQCIAAFHFAQTPLKGLECLLWLCDYRSQQVWNIIVKLELDNLRVNENHLYVFEASLIQDRKNQRVYTN